MPDLLNLKRPSTPEILANLVRGAGRLGWQLKLTGSDAMPLTRFPSPRPILPVSTMRLNKIVQHAVGDMTVTVQAGISLEALQRQLAWRNQWLPIDPPGLGITGPGVSRGPGTRTLGGLIASNSLGPLRMSLAGGDWRRLILGVRWVDAAGTLLKGGGQTVKNVAGYSTPRMLIGSAGTLGVIAEVTLRTFARPADEQCVIFVCRTPEEAEALLAAILTAPSTPDYLQLVGSHTWKGNPLGLPAPGESPNRAGEGLVLVAGFLGRPETCAAQCEIVRNLPPARSLDAIAQSVAPAGRLRLWMTTEPVPEDGASFRLHVASSDVAGILSRLQRDTPTLWALSEAGSGIIRGVLPLNQAPAVLNALAKSHGRNLLITRGSFLPLSPDPLSQRLKAALDPQDVFGQFP